MKVGIIGAGFTGLAAAYYLQKEGHEVSIFERQKEPGGLAIGYKEEGWDWTLEEHYHHWFTNDKDILGLAHEISYPVVVRRPKTSSFVDNGIFQLDSPISLLKFPKLSISERVRVGLSIAFLRFNPFWKLFENFTAEPYLKKTMGENAYKKLWEPLMVNKLGKYSSKVSLAWFWARVYKRTASLVYPKGGFLKFGKALEIKIKNKGGKFYYETEVTKLTSDKKVRISYLEKGSSKADVFDKIIVTLPTPVFFKITPSLPKKYVSKYSSLKGIGALNLVLRLKKPFFKDNTYWLSVCDTDSPILAIVEHTNFMDKKNYNKEHVIYIGNYMETSDKRFEMNKNELLKLYNPWLMKINPKYNKEIIDAKIFRASFAQPIIPIRYSKKVPPIKTPVKNVYLANIQQVYPWDRGTNYAVELGKKAAKIISSK